MTGRIARRAAPVVVALGLLALLAACDIRPGNAIMFRIAGKRTFNTATLTQLDTGAGPRPIRLRFTDTNVFQYNKPLTPGRYKLVLRGNRSFTAVREIDVTADKWLYDLPAIETREGQEAVVVAGRWRAASRPRSRPFPPMSTSCSWANSSWCATRTPKTGRSAWTRRRPAPTGWNCTRRANPRAHGPPPRSRSRHQTRISG